MSSKAAAYFPDTLARSADRQSSVCNHGEPPPAEMPARAAKITPQSTDSSDEELLEEISRGGREALGLLFRRHARSVRNVAGRILRDQAEAEDLLQDIFLFIFRKAALFNPSKGSARSWIFQVAYHRAFNRRQYLATRHFYTALELDEEMLGPGSEAAEIPFYALGIEGLLGRELLDKFTTLLSPDQRLTIELFFFEGYTLKEIAERTGQPLGNVRSYYYRGLERLRAYVLTQKVRSK